MKLLGYIRRSQDSETGVSDDLQREEIERYVGFKKAEVVWLKADMNESGSNLDRPSMQKALTMLAAGEADGIVVAKLDRLTRNLRDFCDLLELSQEQGWKLHVLDLGIDLASDTGAGLAKVLAVFAEMEWNRKRSDMNAARRHAVVEHGAHGGSVAPFGYTWTVRGHDKSGKALKGPLKPTKDAHRVRDFFTRCADASVAPPSWAEAARMLGVPSRNGARAVLVNRVYLGEARSSGKAGVNINPTAHEALVDIETFTRANRRMTKYAAKVAETVTADGEKRDGALLGGRILRCPCGYALIHDSSHYRCKQPGTGHVSVKAADVEPLVLAAALRWHWAAHEVMAQTHATDLTEIGLAVFEEELAKTQAAYDEVEAAAEEMSPTAYGKALTQAEKALTAAREALISAEASHGWHGLAPEQVAHRLGIAPVEEPNRWTLDSVEVRSIPDARQFIREMLTVTVAPAGRGNRMPMADRLTIKRLGLEEAQAEVAEAVAA